jgi:hypothetical protein
MATFNETRILNQVTTLPAQGAVNVQWANIVTKDDVEISKTYERKAYSADQKAEFLAEVEGAEAYVVAMGWE